MTKEIDNLLLTGSKIWKKGGEVYFFNKLSTNTL